MAKRTAEDKLNARLEQIAEMKAFAQAILEALETGETVEELEDAVAAVEEARDAAKALLAVEVES
jgi:hypothetical protein